MPDQTRVVVFAAAGTQDVLATWRYRKAPYRGLVTLLLGSSIAGSTVQVLSGAQEIVQSGSAVQLMAAATTIPVPFTAPVHQFMAMQDDEITAPVTLTGAGNANCWVSIEPA